MYQPINFFMDFAIAAGLIVVSQLIRSKVKVIQDFFIPAPLLAGMLGLLAGPQFLNWLPLSDGMTSYATILMFIVFAGLFIGQTADDGILNEVKKVSNAFYLNASADVGQYAIFTLLGATLLAWLFPELPKGFAILLPAGFVGGHGAAAAIGQSLIDSTGWEDATMVGFTFATLGMLMAAITGIIVIKYAVSKGYTNYVTTLDKLPDDMRTGFVSKGADAVPLGRETTSSMSIETITWHLCLSLVGLGLGYWFADFAASFNLPFALPKIVFCMLGGILVNAVMGKLGYAHTIDRNMSVRINSVLTDFMVFFGIASIRIDIVIEFIQPILILLVFGLLSALFFVFFVGKRFFRDNWFERGIFMFGWSTGTVAFGITLLRIVDPNFKSTTLADYSVAYSLISFIELGLISLTPMMVVNGLGLVWGLGLLVGYVALLYAAHRGNKKAAASASAQKAS